MRELKNPSLAKYSLMGALKFIVYSSSFIVVFSSCHHNPLDIDVSKVYVQPVKIDRMERDIFAMPPDSVNPYTRRMEKKYGIFYTDFVTSFLNNGGIMDSTYAAGLRRFITDKDMRETYDSCEKIYPDVSFLADGMTDAFRHFKFYFPDKPLPKVVTVMSGYSYGIIYYDSTLAISLERYLGKNNLLYTYAQLPRYKTLYMNKDNMECDAVYGWIESIFKPNEDKNDLLAEIIHEGKIMYALDAMLPKVNDTIKIRYTKKQLEWCKDNEFNMWAYIIREKLLYSTDQSNIAKLMDDGPFTSFFNHDLSPSRTGFWIGWQIVRTYMKNNPEVTIPHLMAMNNADKILKESGYKPSK
jgi:hypothetical protein